MVPVHLDYSTCLTTESSPVGLLQRLFTNPSYRHFPNPDSIPTTFIALHYTCLALMNTHYLQSPTLNGCEMPRHANKHPCSLVTLLSAIVPALRKNHYKTPLYPRPTAIESPGYQISPLSLSPYLYLIQAFRVNSPSQRLITSNYATVDLQPLVYLPTSHHAGGKQRLGRQCWTWMFIEKRRNSSRCSAVPSVFRLFFSILQQQVQCLSVFTIRRCNSGKFGCWGSQQAHDNVAPPQTILDRPP